MLPLILMAAGTAMQIAGNYASNMDRASAEMQNAQWYDDQAQLYMEATLRQQTLASKRYAGRLGAQYGGYAKGGVDVGSGSAEQVVAGTLADKMQELAAIERQGALDLKLARMRGFQSAQTAATLGSSSFNLVQGATTLLSNYGATEGFGTWEKTPTGGGAEVPKYNFKTPTVSSTGGLNQSGTSWMDFFSKSQRT